MWLVVTPAHNEARNLPKLAESLRAQSWTPDLLWVIVDDKSTDGTADVAAELETPFRTLVVTRNAETGLIRGAAFAAWRFGVQAGVDALGQAPERVMKLDGDIVLPATYFSELRDNLRASDREIGLAGGVVATPGSREQNHHIPGALKCYSWEAFEALRGIPSSVGFDVLDEVALREFGFEVRVLPHLRVDVARPTGSSAGWVAGRRRNGLMMRWTGYDPLYAALHTLRYVFRKPYGIGSLAIIFGYLSAGSGPYPAALKAAHARTQRRKLASFVANPGRWLRTAYGRDGGSS